MGPTSSATAGARFPSTTAEAGAAAAAPVAYAPKVVPARIDDYGTAAVNQGADPRNPTPTRECFKNAADVVQPHGFEFSIVQVCVAILMLVGFESVTSMGEEAKNPKRDIPRRCCCPCSSRGLSATCWSISRPTTCSTATTRRLRRRAIRLRWEAAPIRTVCARAAWRSGRKPALCSCTWWKKVWRTQKAIAGASLSGRPPAHRRAHPRLHALSAARKCDSPRSGRPDGHRLQRRGRGHDGSRDLGRRPSRAGRPSRQRHTLRHRRHRLVSAHRPAHRRRRGNFIKVDTFAAAAARIRPHADGKVANLSRCHTPARAVGVNDAAGRDAERLAPANPLHCFASQASR